VKIEGFIEADTGSPMPTATNDNQREIERHAFGLSARRLDPVVFSWQAFIIEGLKNSPEQGREAWLPG
jgi:hypothetical protein